MNGVERINLAIPNPGATDRLSLPHYRGASFNSTFSSWWINYFQGFMRFNLALPRPQGVSLILRLCSTTYQGSTSCPITVIVNDTRLFRNWDPHITNFYDKSWYIPASLLRSGNNDIIVYLSGGRTAVLIQGFSVMALEMQRQQQEYWCWSALSTSTSHFFDAKSPWTQCSLVNAEFGENDCCENGSSPRCSRPWNTASGLECTGNLASARDEPQPVETVEGQINIGRPMGASLSWGSGVGHAVALSGVGHVQTMVAVEDPFIGTSYMPYLTFRERYQGKGRWVRSYFTKPNSEHADGR
ncbi:MAG: hypothetical protein LC634_02370 [Sphingomonadales bacterium]|nr:hypothetical protein [Sphingomonadales bacterium]